MKLAVDLLLVSRFPTFDKLNPTGLTLTKPVVGDELSEKPWFVGHALDVGTNCDE